MRMNKMKGRTTQTLEKKEKKERREILTKTTNLI